jgi:DNA-binding MarR family transcriptional regulator
LTYFESEEHEIAVILRHSVLLMTNIRRYELAHFDITPQQIGVMRFMQKFPTACTIIQLRKTMRRSNSSLVAIINRLERKGLVQRQTDSKSKKYTRVFVTEKGKELFKKAMELSAFTIIISSLPVEDRHRLKSYVNTINRTAEKILDEHHKANRKIQKEEN